MFLKVAIIGIHPIPADEPVHLIELLVEGVTEKFDIGEVTQQVPDQPRSNWQSPYDARVLQASNDKIRYAFFFHYLDLGQPLLTPIGPLPLPPPTNKPKYLDDIEYESP